MAFNFSSCCFARGPHQWAHIWLRLTYLLGARAMQYLHAILQTLPISASIKMHPKEEPKGCRSEIWSLGRVPSRGGSTVSDCDWQLFHFTHFINPRRQYWDKSSVLNWGLTPSSCCNLTEKQSKGGWLWIWGIFFPVYLLLCVITDLFFVICNLALRGAADAAGVQLVASQRSGFSYFLFRAAAESQERITFSSENLFFVNSQASWFISARTFLDSRVEVACSKPPKLLLAALQLAPAIGI